MHLSLLVPARADWRVRSSAASGRPARWHCGAWKGSEPPGPRLGVTPGAGMSRSLSWCVCGGGGVRASE